MIKFIKNILFLLIILCVNTADLLEAIHLQGSDDIVVDRKIFWLLPHGSTTGSILENFITPVVFLPVETGGLSRYDSPRFFLRGVSWVEQNWFVNDADITDPFKSGCPIFEPVWKSINAIQINDNLENDPYLIGLNWDIDSNSTANRMGIQVDSTFFGGNASLIPRDRMDREPSFKYGSPVQRRRYKYHWAFNLEYNIKNNYFYNFEYSLAKRKYPTLVNSKGEYVDEFIKSFKLSSVYHVEKKIPGKVTFIIGNNNNNNYGANLRLNDYNTFKQSRSYIHFGYNGSKEIRTGKLNFITGFTPVMEKVRPKLNKPREMEFITESGPLPDGGKINRFNFNNRVGYENKLIGVNYGSQFTGVFYTPDIPYSETIINTNGNAVFRTKWETRKCRELVINNCVKFDIKKEWNYILLKGNVLIDAVSAFANGKNLINWPGLGGQLLVKLKFDKPRTYLDLGVMHQPAKLSSQVVSFLNNARPSGRIYTDINTNGNIEISGADFYGTTGGKYHTSIDKLKRPYHDAFYFSYTQGIGRRFKFILQGSHRIYSDYFVVKYENNNGTYTNIDGTLIYTKPAGEDKYIISNYKKKRGHYSGAEIQFIWEFNRVYLNLMFTAYLVNIFAPMGNGPDYNEYPIVSENSASPNSRINAYGRMDSDRSYMANLLLGWNVRHDLDMGLTIKYRDGEPFSPYREYNDQNGVPVKVIDKPRGNWDGRGIGRYTFSWNIDFRIKYSPKIKNHRLIVTLDIYNLLGSATELIESFRVEDKRKSLEAVPPRMIKLSCAYYF